MTHTIFALRCAGKRLGVRENSVCYPSLRSSSAYSTSLNTMTSAVLFGARENGVCHPRAVKECGVIPEEEEEEDLRR